MGKTKLVTLAEPAAFAGFRSLMRQAAPMILSRAGLAAMTIVGAVLTARHGAGELAVLNLSEGTFGRLADIFIAAMLSGAVLVAGARADARRRLASWRRAAAAAALFGLVGIAVACEARPILALMGQHPGLAARAAPVMLTMALGLPFGLVAIACAVHLEAIGRAGLVTRWLVGANIVNLLLGFALIGGAFGLPGLGAEGAVLTAAIVRFALAVALTATLRAVEGPGLFRRAGTKVAPGRQLALGATAAGTSAGMHALGVWLTIFAGWLGPLSLAAYASTWTFNLPGLVMAMGVADAIAIRAAAAKTEDDDTTRPDLLALSAGLAVLALGLSGFSGIFARAYVADPDLQRLLAGLIPLGAIVLWLDGTSLGVFAALRARGDIAGPTAIQIGSMAATAVLGWLLAVGAGFGAHGLFLAILPTSALRLALLESRLQRAPRLVPAPRFVSESRV